MKNNPDNFCYWLCGFFELTDSKTLSDKQVKIIKEHLDLVFDKVTSTEKDVSISEEAKKCYPLPTVISNPPDANYCNRGSEYDLLNSRFMGDSAGDFTRKLC